MSIKTLIATRVSNICPELFFNIAYLHNRGKFPNLKSPKDLSEIWIKKIINGEIDKIYYLADKYKVREYVEGRGLKDILPFLIGVYSNVEEIDFERLPKRFALKMNFGCGMNLICLDKAKFNVNEAKEKLNKWLLSSHIYSMSERHYNLIEHKIICEEFIDDGHNGFPFDYKFMCICGHVFCILACKNRETGHGFYSPYDLNWNLLKEYDKFNRSESIPCPNNLNEMIKVAEILSKGIELVRVDLYSNGKTIWFGEMTLTPAGCIFHGWTQKALDDMGSFYRKIRQ